MPTQPSFISDDFDGSHDLKTARTKARKMGGKLDIRAHDNADRDVQKGDWVQLSDFDANIGEVKDIYQINPDSWQIVVELADGTYETVDSYSVTKLNPGASSHKRQTHTDSIDYQGGQWFITGQRVQRGHTWYNLRNEQGDKNIVLDKTLHHLRTTHPFYMPNGPFYTYKGKIWYLNDIVKIGGVQYYACRTTSTTG